ncbi:phasin family protein [Caballeronia sp. LZ062]|uniref:phasin family protein n=1 Tax=unclassified Caballeronia TaxID=2646786 RepID=UPI00285E440D|nr:MULTISPECIES: phasin family protein [unclassified Caballeronia]MDR5857575.1 phasin family protein [Caballeronia sp. LZ050]MDR5869125.1 phasin family protein [Caballeronia sp. LZ062]
MSSLAPENFLATQRAGLDATFGFATQAVQGFEKLVDLNVNTLRTALSEHQDFIGKTLAVRDIQEFFAILNGRMQANAQRAQAYWQGVNDIATSVRGAYMQAAQDQLEKSQRNAQAFVESLVTNAPLGSEAVVSAWKSAIDSATQSANCAYEAARNATRQVVQAAQTEASTAVTVPAPTAVRVVSSKPANAKK